MNTVMLVSLVLCAAIAIWGVVDPDSMTGSAQWLVNYSLTALDWYFLALCTGFLVIMGFMAMSKYGKIKLGDDNDEPEFSTGSWIAMLFAAGMGSGLLFWGVAEPIYHYATPPVGEAETATAARNAMVITNFHWGLHAWSIYGCCALVIAYFTFRLKLPSMVSTPIMVGFKNVFAPKALKQIGNTSDILAVIAVIFGLAGSLAMGTLMVRSGMNAVFDTPTDVTMSMVIIVVMTICFLLSACTGVDKGIKILSNINMIVAIMILLVVLFGGPTAYLFQSFIYAIGDYLIQLIPMSFKTYAYTPAGSWNWFHGWTLTYLIWWLAWGPFVGIFIARISRGRTIREFVTYVVGVPTIVSMLWFAAFGGAAIHIEMFGAGGITENVFADVAGALFVFFEYFPGTDLLNFLAVCLIFIFLVTSADSGTFVISMMTSNGSLNPATKLKLTWGLIITGITVATIVTESVTVAKAMAITGAIPFTFIIIMQLAAFARVVREDPMVREKHTEVRPVASDNADSSAAQET
ncbi:MAG: BCCT family transporter [Gammaproteobacteria bacterium]|nr:BCCT family transporter [Gammaproteobacteria bacterium]MCP4984355.1 BCCT family transporter [Gammaproteobacteria bacterium]